MSTERERRRRRFSEGVKRESVSRIEKGKIRISALCAELDVSRASVYRWLSKYSLTYGTPYRIIVEKKSQTNKVKELQLQLKELEAALGRKQMQVDYLSKLIELTEAEEGIEILKKDERPRSNGSGNKRKPKPGR